MAVFRNPGDDTLYGLMSHLTVREAAMFWGNASSEFQLSASSDHALCLGILRCCSLVFAVRSIF
jgi:hypothetical protein